MLLFFGADVNIFTQLFLCTVLNTIKFDERNKQPCYSLQQY